MKIFILCLIAFTISLSSFGQAKKISKELPPREMLPKHGEVKQIYELPSKTNYEVFNSKGELVAKENGQFIDYTKYDLGTYFVRFDGVTESFTKQDLLLQKSPSDYITS